MKKPISVLIVDDSALIRKLLTDILNSDPDIEVMAAVGDPYFAAKKIKEQLPDVITLDIEMPRMDGLTFLKTIMSQKPMPVIILSSLTERGSQTALKALEFGALDVIKKPTMTALRNHDDRLRNHLLDLVKAAAVVKNTKLKKLHTTKKAPVQEVKVPVSSKSMIKTTEKVVVIGASTGGTEAIKEILTALPHDSPAIVIVQHMPEAYTKAFADRLNQLCNITVKEASNGDSLIRGQALIAPGNYHTVIRRSGARYYVEVKEGERVNRHRPSVDVLFDSAVQYLGKNCVGVLLTGMGKDGAKGLLKLKEAGAYTVAQNQETSVVFGMPKEAIKLEAALAIEPLQDIPSIICQQTMQ
ncbi:chemotaxis response regulator protein-glutamate methylesterase [Fulvivirga kasyanovii]|uniref:Protein-glutamate methylesterase/protein-glutamine glutaminase n=1 Tax=Fulvivirga kasyanovii TaxID=396812 RepID=A0ABW9RNJ7_9BACT|nr:chemotaxis response regulator protein-glutamate methylesterase [Fulvivirga kasyanovii]MTI25717.1 chemotaxis response regulator protein-glutamate methylesterase [Fulvivirga kasyanovii]